jgi:hypothetical protein
MLSKSSLALGLAMMRQSLAQSRQPAFSHTLVFDSTEKRMSGAIT